MADYGKPRIKKFSSSVLERIKSNQPPASGGPMDFMNHTPSSFDFAGHNPVSANIDADTRRPQSDGPQHPIFGGDKKADGVKRFAGHRKKDGGLHFKSSLNVKPSGNYKASFKF